MLHFVCLIKYDDLNYDTFVEMPFFLPSCILEYKQTCIFFNDLATPMQHVINQTLYTFTQLSQSLQAVSSLDSRLLACVAPCTCVNRLQSNQYTIESNHSIDQFMFLSLSSVIVTELIVLLTCEQLVVSLGSPPPVASV